MQHDSPEPRARRLRIMTYNGHGCRGTDGRVEPLRIAEVIAAEEPDIVALQELDVGRLRSGGIDQARAIAAHLKVTSHFHPAVSLAEEKYGDAILTALPSRLVKTGELPSKGEPRGAIWIAVEFGGAHLHVFNTHFGLRRGERMHQAATILGPLWMASPEAFAHPRILLGDFNSVPSSAAYRMLASRFADASAVNRRASATFPSRLPLLRLDHVFVDERISVSAARVVRSRLARIASDHCPLVVDVEIDPAGMRQTAIERAPATSGNSHRRVPQPGRVA